MALEIVRGSVAVDTVKDLFKFILKYEDLFGFMLMHQDLFRFILIHIRFYRNC